MENASEKSKKTRGVKNAINKIMQDDDENVASVSSNKSESLKSSTPATIRAPVPSSTSAPKSKNSSTLKPNDDMTSDSNSDVMDTQVHAEHEDEGYFLGHEEDSGEDSDVDNARENSDEEEDAGIYMNGNDTDDIFEQCTDDNQLDIDEPISSHTRLQEKTFESIHPHEQTAERDTSSSGGSIADDESPMKSTTTGPETQSHMQEMTVDDHGNKVPINNTEARRDSGYDLLH
ncbi:hypothetical protein FBU30_006557 [Linnemannia zychae]|nr:hypothetical protein FBU30_006557 [Linnemannia zychae]